MTERKQGLYYLAQPARLGGVSSIGNRNQVIEAVTGLGYDVTHPFEALPYERFEGNPDVGRDRAMRYCCHLVDACVGGIIVSGISEGTLREVTHFLSKRYDDQGRVLIDATEEFDPEHQAYRESLGDRYGNTLGRMAAIAVNL